MRYPAVVSGQEGDYTVTFRDVPEAITGAATVEDALELAPNCLITALSFYRQEKRLPPQPSCLRDGEVSVPVPASAFAKLMLLRALHNSKVTPAELAREMGITPQAVNRLLDLGHTTKIDTINDALHVLGLELLIHFNPIGFEV